MVTHCYEDPLIYKLAVVFTTIKIGYVKSIPYFYVKQHDYHD